MNELSKEIQGNEANTLLETATIRKGYYDRNSKYIDGEGWLCTPFFKLTPKGKKLMEQKGFGCYRPKSLSGCC